MKRILILLAALCAAAPAYAQTVDATLDAIRKDAKNNLEKLTALDKSDKALKTSNEAQIYSTQAANKMEKEVKDAMGPLQMDANRADEFRNQIIASGCPQHGGEVELSIAQRCNPLIAQHRAMTEAIVRRVDELKAKSATAKTLRENITQTTLKNTEQQKRNNEERGRLMAQRTEIQARAVIAGLRNKAAAEKACSSMPTVDGQACCHKVVFDSADPKLCGVGLMCQAFERGGLFGSGVTICQPKA